MIIDLKIRTFVRKIRAFNWAGRKLKDIRFRHPCEPTSSLGILFYDATYILKATPNVTRSLLDSWNFDEKKRRCKYGVIISYIIELSNCKHFFFFSFLQILGKCVFVLFSSLVVNQVICHFTYTTVYILTVWVFC